MNVGDLTFLEPQALKLGHKIGNGNRSTYGLCRLYVIDIRVGYLLKFPFRKISPHFKKQDIRF